MKATYKVSGMTCGNCVRHVLEEINELPGLTAATLNLAGELVIESDEAIDFDRIVEAVAEAGDYEVE